MRVRAAAVACGLGLLWAAVAGALDPERKISQYGLRVWQDELPQQTVHSIVQTVDGYLWLGTYEGLVRFDGVRFEVFDAKRRGQDHGTSVLHLRVDGAGGLWIGTNGGLVLLEAGRFRSWAIADGLPSEVVTATCDAAGGGTWVGTDRGLARLTADRRLERGPVALAGVPVHDLKPDPDGRLWVATANGLFAIGPAGVTRLGPGEGLPSADCRVLVRRRDGSLWVGTAAGLVRLRADRFEPVAAGGLPGAFITSLLEDSHGVLWVGTDAGLARLAGSAVEVAPLAEGSVAPELRSLFEDREGLLWVGTNSGLLQLQDGKVTTFTTREHLSSDFVRCVLESSDGSIWIGTDGGGANRLRNGEVTVFGSADGLVDDSVRAIAEDSDGGIWLGTRGGLSRLADGRFRNFTSRDGLSSDAVRSLLVDSRGQLWIGTEGGGLNRWDGDRFAHFTTRDGLAGNDVRALLEDRSGALWVGTFSGMSRLANGTFTTWRTAQGLVNNIVFSFHEDADRSLWIGTDGGLNLLRDGRFTSFDTGTGLLDNKVFRILADDSDHLWLSSNRGLCRVARADLLAVADGKATRVEAMTFNRADGMRTNQCNGATQPAGWRSRDGRLWFPTARGVVTVDPNRLRLNPLPPPVLVEEVLVDGVAASPGQVTVVPHSAERLELRYTALSFPAPERVRFRCMLEGFDRGWVDAGTRRSATYTNLSPGHYRFRVQACNNDGVWNLAGATSDLELEAAPWETWWAWLIYVVAFGLLVAGGVRLRVRGLERRNALLQAKVAERTVELDSKNVALAEKVHQLEQSESRAHDSERRALEASRAKTVFLSTMSHELRTPLNSIIGFTSILQEKLQAGLEPRYVRFLGNILTSGQHLLGLINDLLDLSKIEAGRMEVTVETFEPLAMLEGLRSLMRGMSERQQVEIELEAKAELPTMTADLVKVKQILFNLVSNAVKFSPAGSTVTLRAASLAAAESPLGVESMRFDVVDRGVGIAPEHHEVIFEEFRQVRSSSRQPGGTGLGLALVRRLLAIQGGSVSVQSELGKGSTFSAFLPLAVPPTGGEPPALAVPIAAQPGKRPPILVVEDDPVAFHSLATVLEAEGFRVVGARTGEEALRALEVERPALVTLDLVLPGLDGWDVLKRIKEQAETRDVPVLIVTRLSDRDLCLALGARDLFVKPVDEGSFLERVRSLTRASSRPDHPVRVLLVDDDPAVHEVLRPELEAAGYEVTSCHDGRSAVEQAQRLAPDLVVLDLMMPGMSGFEVAHELSQQPATANLPIVVLSALALSEVDRTQLVGRIAAHVRKGGDATRQLVTTIRDLVG